MQNIEKLKPTGLFTNYIYKAIPLAFDESMSYYETLCGLLDYLENTVIPTVNNNADAMIELQNLYIELHDYVEHYFENLDVQEEINNKLDDMVEDGTLDQIIEQYLNSGAFWGFDTVADMKNATNLINGSYAKTIGFHEKNDNGGASYKIRTITNDDVVDEKKIIALYDNTLVAELIIENCLNIKQIGAYGDDSHDDTSILTYAINNFDTIYIPKGIYKITDEIPLKANLHIYGDGNSSILKSYFTYNDTIKYILKSDSTSTSITRTIIEKVKFINNTANTLSGGIYIEYSTRGLILHDLWFDAISNCIKLGEKIWGTANLNNIFSVYLPTELDENINTLSYGIYCKGNTTYGNNIEIIGRNKYGLYLHGCQVGSWKNLNISGSNSLQLMKNAILVENCKDIEINDGWFEQLSDGESITKAINILNSNQILLHTMHIASGSMFIDGSINVKILNSRYYSTNAGLRYMNNSQITCDLISLGYCNYQSNINYNMGVITLVDFENQSNNNIKNNPLYFLGIQEDLAVTNGNFVTKTSNTTDQLTGDRCFNFNCTSNQGASINTSNIFEIGKTYTILAYVKPVTNIKTLAILNEGSTTVTDFPNESFVVTDTTDTSYHLIRKTLTVSNATSSIKIMTTLVDTSVRGDFLIDSVFIVEGKHDNIIPSTLSKNGIMRNAKLTAGVSPWTGTWSKGDIVYNNFVSEANDNILYWVYNGTTWVAVEFQS